MKNRALDVIRRFWHWEHSALAMLLATLTLEWLLSGCAPRPQAREPAAAEVPWCFRAVARFNGTDQAAVGCFATGQLCDNAQRRAVRLGGLAGLREVGTCRRGE
jgi:hypothetical protein